MTSQVHPEAFQFSAGKIGVLLIHGYTGSPSEMRPLGQFLHEKGYTVHGIQLKGHGKTAEDMTATNWRDWWESVVHGYAQLAETCEKVFVCGLSMGGCLSLLLAGTFGELTRRLETGALLNARLKSIDRSIPESLQNKLIGIVPMCAPVWVRDWKARIAPMLGQFIPYWPSSKRQPDHIHPYIHYFGKTPVRTVSSLLRIIKLMKQRLPYIKIPVLILQSRLDQTIQPRSAFYIQSHVGCKDCELKWYENSDHILVLDHDREQVFADISAFIERLLSESSN